MIKLLISAFLVLLVTIPVSVAPMILGFIPLRFRSPMIIPVFKIWGRLLCKILRMKVKVIGLENLPPDYNKHHLVIANHQSLLDIPLIAGVIGLPYLMIKELLKVPFLGYGATFYGCIPFDRKDRSARLNAGKKVIRQIENDVSTVTFPEGTRALDGNLKEKIHAGLLKLAYRRKTPVIALTLKNTHLVLSYPGKLPRINKPVEVEIRIHPVKNPINYESHEEFVESTWGEIRRSFKQDA